MPLVECVPNISEGRDRSKIEAIADEARKVAGVTLVSCESDADHNRSVITFAGSPEAVLEAAFRIYRKGQALIDLNQHHGEHPRMGAVDVCPFIPIADCSMEDCAELARKLGARVGRELEIPVYLYESAATRPERKNLADIRKGQFEKLRDQIGKDPARVPDFGPNRIHPTFGATAIGARFFLIAWNVNLESADVEIAKRIAHSIREKDGGMPAVKAMGFMLEKEGVAQVSMNLVDYRKTSPAQAVARISELANANGVSIRESELIGVMPRDAVQTCFAQALKLKDYRPEMVLEHSLREDYMVGVGRFLDDLASGSPTPGGGAAAAVLGGIGVALNSMVGNLTVGRKKFAAVEAEARAIIEKSDTLRGRLIQLYREDVAAFDAIMEAFALPKESEADKRARTEAIQGALKGATLSPLACANAAMDGLRLAARIAAIGNPNAISDAGVAALSLSSAVLAATLNMRINLASIQDQTFVGQHRAMVEKLEAEANTLAQSIRQTVIAKIS